MKQKNLSTGWHIWHDGDENLDDKLKPRVWAHPRYSHVKFGDKEIGVRIGALKGETYIASIYERNKKPYARIWWRDRNHGWTVLEDINLVSMATMHKLGQ